MPCRARLQTMGGRWGIAVVGRVFGLVKRSALAALLVGISPYILSSQGQAVALQVLPKFQIEGCADDIAVIRHIRWTWHTGQFLSIIVCNRPVQTSDPKYTPCMVPVGVAGDFIHGATYEVKQKRVSLFGSLLYGIPNGSPIQSGLNFIPWNERWSSIYNRFLHENDVTAIELRHSHNLLAAVTTL